MSRPVPDTRDGSSTPSGGDDPLGEPALPFRVQDEDQVWSGGVVTVGVASVAVDEPGGELHRRDIVHHPGAVAAVPVHDDGSVTLVYQYRAALDRGLWEIPAGLRDVDDEPTVATARRELAEETGLAADTLRHLVTFHNSAGHSDEVVEIFLATGLTSVPDDRQGVEEQHMVVRRVPLAVAVEMIDRGRITDAKTVIALLRVAADGSAPG